jgi:hypothetical protein
VIHLATIHYGRAEWIAIQARYLRRFSAEPIRVYASLDGVDRTWEGEFDHAVSLGLEMKPADKYDRLGEMMVAEAEPDDLIAFLHGDSFPIREWTRPVRAMLEEAPLVAVRRDENFGEPIPHPSFTVTTAGFWQGLDSSWISGPKWPEPDGKRATDVGARLWADLERRELAWKPLVRSNAVDLHPLWFGIYGDLVYHHGAGFRRPISRADAHRSRRWPMPLRRAHWAWRVGRNSLLARRVTADLRGRGRLLTRLAGFEVAPGGAAG